MYPKSHTYKMKQNEEKDSGTWSSPIEVEVTFKLSQFPILEFANNALVDATELLICYGSARKSASLETKISVSATTRHWARYVLEFRVSKRPGANLCLLDGQHYLSGEFAGQRKLGKKTLRACNSRILGTSVVASRRTLAAMQRAILCRQIKAGLMKTIP